MFRGEGGGGDYIFTPSKGITNVDQLLDELEKSLAHVELNEEEMRCLKELREYSVGDEGSWVLSDDFLGLIGKFRGFLG